MTRRFRWLIAIALLAALGAAVFRLVIERRAATTATPAATSNRAASLELTEGDIVTAANMTFSQSWSQVLRGSVQSLTLPY